MDLRVMLGVLFLFLFTLGLGYYARKRGILTEQGRGALSGLLIRVILPCNILTAMEAELTGSILRAILALLILETLCILALWLLCRGAFRARGRDERAVFTYGMICPNSGFMGIPIAEYLYGSMGVLYMSMLLLPMRVFTYSAGLSLFMPQGRDRGGILRSLITHPCILAVLLGLIKMFWGWNFPGFLCGALNSVGRCSGAVSMMIVGAILADTDIRRAFSRDTLLFSALRLLALPLLAFLLVLPLPLDSLVKQIFVLGTCMPAPTIMSVFADQYKGNRALASHCALVSTLLFVPCFLGLGLMLPLL